MYYLYNISTPANTPYENRKRTRIKLAKGTITDVKILFPSGCSGLLSCNIFRGGHQLYPISPGEFFTGDHTDFSFSEYYILSNQPYELVVDSWNLDDTLPHSVICGFNISPPATIKNETTTEQELIDALKELGVEIESD